MRFEHTNSPNWNRLGAKSYNTCKTQQEHNDSYMQLYQKALIDLATSVINLLTLSFHDV